MTAKILDGKLFAQQMRAEIKQAADARKARQHLATVAVIVVADQVVIVVADQVATVVVDQVPVEAVRVDRAKVVTVEARVVVTVRVERDN